MLPRAVCHAEFLCAMLIACTVMHIAKGQMAFPAGQITGSPTQPFQGLFNPFVPMTPFGQPGGSARAATTAQGTAPGGTVSTSTTTSALVSGGTVDPLLARAMGISDLSGFGGSVRTVGESGANTLGQQASSTQTTVFGVDVFGPSSGFVGSLASITNPGIQSPITSQSTTDFNSGGVPITVDGVVENMVTNGK